MPFKHDSKQPIEVTSDALQVFQEENRAVFTGHVVAIQGDVRLKADTMTVYYRAADKAEDAQKKPTSPAEQNAIKKIDATGDVFLSTPEETASGATGTYDVEAQEIHLNQNVILTRAKNVLKGDKLVYSFATGKSVLTGGAAPVQGETQTGGRVRALFVPEDNKPGAKKPETKKDEKKP